MFYADDETGYDFYSIFLSQADASLFFVFFHLFNLNAG